MIADIRATRIYENALRALGASNVECRRLGWRFWWGNPFATTTLLTASKRPKNPSLVRGLRCGCAGSCSLFEAGGSCRSSKAESASHGFRGIFVVYETISWFAKSGTS